MTSPTVSVVKLLTLNGASLKLLATRDWKWYEGGVQVGDLYYRENKLFIYFLSSTLSCIRE